MRSGRRCCTSDSPRQATRKRIQSNATAVQLHPSPRVGTNSSFTSLAPYRVFHEANRLTQDSISKRPPACDLNGTYHGSQNPQLKTAISAEIKKDVLRGRVKGPVEIEFTEEPLTAYAGLELFGRFLRSRRAGLDRITQGLRRSRVRLGLWFVPHVADDDRSSMLLRAVPGWQPSQIRFVSRSALPSLRLSPSASASETNVLALVEGHVTPGLPAASSRVTSGCCLRDLGGEDRCLGSRSALEAGTVIRAGECVDGVRSRLPSPPLGEGSVVLPTDGPSRPNGTNPGCLRTDPYRVQRLGTARSRCSSRSSTRHENASAPFPIRSSAGRCLLPEVPFSTFWRGLAVEYAMKMPIVAVAEHPGPSRSGGRRGYPSTRPGSVVHRRSSGSRSGSGRFGLRRLSEEDLRGKPAKAYQLNLFQPDDGFYEYSTVVTNKSRSSERAVWHFDGPARGGHEKTLGETEAVRGVLDGPRRTMKIANSTWQLLSALTHNLVRDFQARDGHSRRRTSNSRKRTCRWRFPSLRTFRFSDADRAGADLSSRMDGRCLCAWSLPSPHAARSGRSNERLAAVIGSRLPPQRRETMTDRG